MLILGTIRDHEGIKNAATTEMGMPCETVLYVDKTLLIKPSFLNLWLMMKLIPLIVH